ncbi:MAG TPA: RNA polymerase sigma factor [Candidatus Polarisedimenticolia bacterium]|nr:RNA polymerase sigma factor [Candidatus Polarisedimenticolia bacterium]
MDRMDADDANVVARARDGDSEAFRALVERHSRPLFHLAYRITGNEEDAEDVVQETFMKAHRALGRFEERANVGTWLHRIAANCALDIVRSRRREGPRLEAVEQADGGFIDPVEAIPSTQPAPDRLVLSEEMKRRVGAALGQLTPNERTAFVLRHFEDRSIEDIGRTLGLRENAAKQSVFRAVRKLRRALEPVMPAGRA